MAGVRTAIGAGAIEEIYLLAYEHLKRVYNEGDKLFIFGFSRKYFLIYYFTAISCVFILSQPLKNCYFF